MTPQMRRWYSYQSTRIALRALIKREQYILITGKQPEPLTPIEAIQSEKDRQAILNTIRRTNP